MSDRISALGADFKPGRYGELSGGPGVTLSETDFESVMQIVAFENALETTTQLVRDAANKTGGLSFSTARNRWLVAGPASLRDALLPRLDTASASLVDQTHGRAALNVKGTRMEWVLSKLFAIDFRLNAFHAGTGVATMHHDIFAWIYRGTDDSFSVFVPRSFARSFWHTLCRAAEEVGYEVI
jgi:methylglutamate dehydrogenase subunit D